jgi:hypothetical protein
MKTLLVYDLNGRIWNNITGIYVVPNGLPYLEVVIPEGQTITGVDVSVTPHQAILVDAPKSKELTRLELLEVAFNELVMTI